MCASRRRSNSPVLSEQKSRHLWILLWSWITFHDLGLCHANWHMTPDSYLSASRGLNEWASTELPTECGVCSKWGLACESEIHNVWRVAINLGATRTMKLAAYVKCDCWTSVKWWTVIKEIMDSENCCTTMERLVSKYSLHGQWTITLYSLNVNTCRTMVIVV